MRTLAATLFLMLWAMSAGAQTLYKSIGPDGKAVYSDRPPATGRLEKTLKVENLPNTALPAGLAAELQQLRQTGAKPAISASSTVLFAASWCGFCRQARAYLASKGIKYEDIDIETPAGKAAFAAAGGSGGIPLLVLKGQQVRGFSAQAYDQLFASQR
jgi:glutaredoxin